MLKINHIPKDNYRELDAPFALRLYLQYGCKEILAYINQYPEYDPNKILSHMNQYEVLFGHLRDKPIVLLEMGVNYGTSTLMWKNYFSKGQIIGLDPGPCPDILKNQERITYYQGVQEDKQLLQEIVKSTPNGLDIVFDDGAHIGSIARTSYNYLISHVKKDGLYIIEDWGTGYWEGWPDGRHYNEPNHTDGMVGFVKELVDEVGRPDMRGKHKRASLFSKVEYIFGQVIITV